jgi:hypothetical protein
MKWYCEGGKDVSLQVIDIFSRRTITTFPRNQTQLMALLVRVYIYQVSSKSVSWFESAYGNRYIVIKLVNQAEKSHTWLVKGCTAEVFSDSTYKHIYTDHSGN